MPALALGVIAIWNGSLATIPAGWQAADGSNGTPDLRDQFIQGAGGVLTPGDTGGASSHTHTFTSDGHSHTITAGTVLNSGVGFDDDTTTDTDSGTTDAATSLPPFHALAYIIRV